MGYPTLGEDIAMYHRKPHHKSRQGCTRCKAKKIKCNEAKPTCSGCKKYGLECEFAPVKERKRPSSHNTAMVPLRSRAEAIRGDIPLPAPMTAMPTPVDRLLELKLMHNFTLMSAETLFSFISPWRAQSENRCNAGTRWLVDIAMRDEGIMNAVFAFSAFHLRRVNQYDKELEYASHKYTTQAIAAHSEQVRRGTSRENTEIVFAGSLVIAFLTVDSHQDQRSETQREVLPLNWFQPWQGIRAIVCSSWHHFHTDQLKGMLMMGLTESTMPDDMTCNTFDFLLEDLDILTTDPETLEAYESNVKRLGIMYAQPEQDYIFKFAAKVGPRFVKLLEQHDPRTLTIVGYFFMLLKITEQIWWLPKSTVAEFRALMRLLPEEWKPRMEWAAREFEMI